MKPIISDEVLRSAVVKELESDPDIAAKHIAVFAADGAVTLRGHVTSYHAKHEAIRAAERVPAVRAVADEIEVRDPSSRERSDAEIAEAVANRRGRCPGSPDAVGVQVRDGHVILHGRVRSQAEREAAERAARELIGVRAVDNLIEVRSEDPPPAEEIERRVRQAVADAHDGDAGSIEVTIAGGTAHLRGRVPSLEALQAAVRAAGSAGGVMTVESELGVTIREDEAG